MKDLQQMTEEQLRELKPNDLLYNSIRAGYPLGIRVAIEMGAVMPSVFMMHPENHLMVDRIYFDWNQIANLWDEEKIKYFCDYMDDDFSNKS
jgi:hypothetical protein